MDYRRFNDRISYLLNLFGDIKLAVYLNMEGDEMLLDRWANSETLTEAPRDFDFTYMLHKHPEFRKEWLETGEGDIYVSGSVEENETMIRKSQS